MGTEPDLMSPALWNIRIEGEPVSKGRPRAKINCKRDGSLYCQMTTPNKTAGAEQTIWATFKNKYPGQGPAPAGSRIDVWARFCEGLRQREKWQDVDNMLKLVMDALNGVAWEDDRDVVSVTGEVFRGSDVPHTWVVITVEGA